MRNFNFYIELDDNGRIPKISRERLIKYVSILDISKISFSWISNKITYKTISSIISFERKECSHKGLIIENKVISNNKKLNLLVRNIMHLYNFKFNKMWNDCLNDDYIGICFENNPITCYFNSCFGNTLSLFKNGQIGICYNKNNRIMLNDDMNIGNIIEIFNTNSFYEILKKHVEKRKICIQKCKYYKLCKGGCGLEEMGETCVHKNKIETFHNKIEGNIIPIKELKCQIANKISNKYKV